MAFTTDELTSFSQKGWLGILGTGNRFDAPDNLAWYEEITSNHLITDPTQVWTQLPSIPPAADLATAQANALANPTIIEDRTGAGGRVRLTPTENGTTFFATSTFGDLSTRLKNWIMPQLIPLTAGNVGFPSIGYMVTLYNGDPDSGGTEIPTTEEQQPGGSRPGWFMNFGAGAISTASGFSAITDPNDVWIRGFRYIGTTAGSGSTIPVSASPPGSPANGDLWVRSTDSQVFAYSSSKSLWLSDIHYLHFGARKTDNRRLGLPGDPVPSTDSHYRIDEDSILERMSIRAGLGNQTKSFDVLVNSAVAKTVSLVAGVALDLNFDVLVDSGDLVAMKSQAGGAAAENVTCTLGVRLRVDP